jgi:GNAT superfamily N-acetyltransferase
MLRTTATGYEVSDDPDRLSLDVITDFLAEAYWSSHRSRDVIEASVSHSLAAGLYAPGGEQVGFARAITDRATFAYLADVFVLPEHRGRGLSRFLVTALMEHPDLTTVSRWLLVTADAHGVYTPMGFGALPDPGIFMVRESAPSS